uniref:Universal stress protein n=1 Tax=Roseihalotalea indica TaxID=2867963 RepID=A0AA49GKY9_9BACT|nr:universal stress protein [Tunicatimonas sp. TK19036]
MKAIKHILFPTDFSPTANNALLYAIALAQTVSAKIYILHVCRIPSASVSAYPIGYYEAVNMDELRQEAQKKMESLHHDFLYAPKVPYECITELGPTSELIEHTIREKNIDLVVMGSRRANGAQAWFGSVTSDIVKNSKVPVLVVPQNARFIRPEKVVLATTLDKMTHLAGLEALRTFAQVFNASVDVLHIHPVGQDYSLEQNRFRQALDQYLTNVPHRFIFVSHKDVNEGIQQYFDNHQAEMLVMMPHHHTFLEGLVHASKTKYMIFHTQKPLLALKS